MFDKLFRSLLTKRVLHHSIFWGVNIAFGFIIPFYGKDVTYMYFLPRVLSVFAMLTFPVYVNLQILIPKYLRSKQYWTYALWVFIISSIFAFCKIYFKLGILGDPIDENIWEEISTGLFLPIMYIMGTSFLKFFREWISYQDIALKLKETENEKLEAELKFLKSQLNPHFMFNTLNNIYSLSLDKSDLTPEVVLKLSDIMSYTLYDCKEDKVEVKDEIEFINNYIELEKIRIGGMAQIEFEVLGDYMDQKIAPLLFMPFVENAFKHGINNRPADAYIKMLLEFNEKDQMSFSIENNVNSNLKTDKEQQGIGIENVKKRLALLYPQSHKLQIINQDEFYKVELIIDLN